MGTKDQATERGERQAGFYEQALGWETSRILEVEKSRRKAWLAFYLMAGIAVLSWGAIVMMMPLKERIPYLVRVDNNTGATDIVTVLKSKDVSTDEVMVKHWLHRYVAARETYDWFTLQDDYEFVGAFSGKDTGEEYAAQFGGENGLDKVNGDRVRRTVDVLSIVPTANGSATVRFITKETSTLSKGAAPRTQGWVATIGYVVPEDCALSEEARMVNPTCFQVMSYRRDPEAIGGGQ